MTAAYDPTVFESATLDAAKRIILTPTPSQDTETRWERETPYMTELLGDLLKPQRGQLVLDYGCGIGRLSKALIKRFGCRVIGVDISLQMRCLAPRYVDDAGFAVVSRYSLQGLVQNGLRADAAFSAWVLQHCQQPADDIAIIAATLRAGAPFGVVNAHGRYLPVQGGAWVEDGQDVKALLAAGFEMDRQVPLDAEILGRELAADSYGALYRRR